MLVEFEQIGMVGVGEFIVLLICIFYCFLQIDEQEFLCVVVGIFKLLILFENWCLLGDCFFYLFGIIGYGIWVVFFYYFWLDSLCRGMFFDLGDFCLESIVLCGDCFLLYIQLQVSYVYYFDVGLYVWFLCCKVEVYGLWWIEGWIVQVRQYVYDGLVQVLVLDDGQVIEGDLFIDCIGFRGLLIEQVLGIGYEDWYEWLLCDCVVVVQIEVVVLLVFYIWVIVYEVGWCWYIVLQYCVGCGLVYDSCYLFDDEVVVKLLCDVGVLFLCDLWKVLFCSGCWLKVWNRNVVLFGLVSGFIELLELISIYLMISVVVCLIQLFLFDGISVLLVQLYNDVSWQEMEYVCDFIILYYYVMQCSELMWKVCCEMCVLELLQQWLQVWCECVYVWQDFGELFCVEFWISVLFGQGIVFGFVYLLVWVVSDVDLCILLKGI